MQEAVNDGASLADVMRAGALVLRKPLTGRVQSSITRFKLEYDPPAPASPSPPLEVRTGGSPLPDVMFASSRVRGSRSASPTGRQPLFARSGSADDDDDSDGRRVPGRAEAVARALAATAASIDIDEADNFDLDDLIRQADEDARVAEAEMALGPNALRAPNDPKRRKPAARAVADEDDEMDIDWAELDAIDAEIAAGGGRSHTSAKQRQRTTEAERPVPGGDADEEDWDAFDEMNG